MTDQTASLQNEPPELGARRSKLLEGLQTEIDQQSGPVQAFLRTLRQAVESTKPEAPLDEQAAKDFVAGCNRLVGLAQNGKLTAPLPAIIGDASRFIADNMNSFRERAIKAGVPVSADAAATIETVATAVKAIGDGFAAPVSRGAAAALGNVDAPTGAEDKREVPEELKNWKNPALYGAK